jgi:hypothetical protein
MEETITAGTILIENGTPIPEFRAPQGATYSNGWLSLGRVARAELEKSVSQAGWSFFYMAGHSRATVFGFDPVRTMHKALKRLIAGTTAQHFNCLEISSVETKHFLGVPYVSISAHSRHIQKSLVLAEYQQR